jgi:DNA-binding transcriptional LysR family regulator
VFFSVAGQAVDDDDTVRDRQPDAVQLDRVGRTLDSRVVRALEQLDAGGEGLASGRSCRLRLRRLLLGACPARRGILSSAKIAAFRPTFELDSGSCRG